jgi:hypothetical protein
MRAGGDRENGGDKANGVFSQSTTPKFQHPILWRTHNVKCEPQWGAVLDILHIIWEVVSKYDMNT